MEICKCLHNFFLCRHDKWSICDDRLIEGLTCHKKKLCFCRRCESDIRSWFWEVYHVSILEIFFSRDYLSFSDEEHTRISFRKCDIERSYRVKAYIVELYLRKCLRCSGNSLKLSSNHSHSSSCKFYFRDTLSCECLISRSCHLISTRKIDPELDSMLYPTHEWESLRHELIVEKSTSSRHPLDFICTDHSSISCRILMFYFSWVDDRDGLKSSMWMKSDSRTMSILWFKLPRSIVVEHEKWARIIRHFSSISGDILWYSKSISYHVILARMFQSKNFLLHFHKICYNITMSNTPKRKHPLKSEHDHWVIQKTQEEIIFSVESIHQILWSNLIAICGGNSRYLSGTHDVTIYGDSTIFSPELRDSMMNKVIRVNVLLTTHTRWVDGIDASEIVGNIQSIISIEDGNDYK